MTKSDECATNLLNGSSHGTTLSKAPPLVDRELEITEELRPRAQQRVAPTEHATRHVGPRGGAVEQQVAVPECVDPLRETHRHRPAMDAATAGSSGTTAPRPSARPTGVRPADRVSSSDGHFDSASPGYIRNQMTNTCTSALGCFASSSFCAHRAPAMQAGQVGETSRIRRGCPLNVLNQLLSSSMPRSCPRVGAAAATRGVANMTSAIPTTTGSDALHRFPLHGHYLPSPINGQYNGTSSSRINAGHHR